MKLDNTFSVTAPIEQVWTALMDVDKVASCVPGAQVLDQLSDDSYLVGMKVKLGPMSMQYRGQMDVVTRDEAARRATMRGKAKETRGQGQAEATVEMALTEEGQQTHGTVHADVRLSGRAAAMGQGVITSVADQMLGQFAHNLEVMLNEPQSKQPAGAGPGDAGDQDAGRRDAGAPDPGDDERSGENVVEGVDTLAAGTRSAGVQKSPDRAKARRSPVEQVRGDEDMTEGQEVTGSGESGSGDSASPAGSGGLGPSEAPTSGGVSGGAQSIAGGRVSDRVAADDGRPSVSTTGRSGASGSDDGGTLDALALIRSMLSGQLREHPGAAGLIGVVAVVAFLLGRSSGRR